MFTGIVQELGQVISVESLEEGVEVCVCASRTDSLTVGDSINVEGVCSTVIKKDASFFTVQYLPETLHKTTLNKLKKDQLVNLEQALTLSAKLGGHLMSGHIDGVGQIRKIEKNEPWGYIEIEFDPKDAGLVVYKGSIAINGISLTVVDAQKNWFSCHLIPHTFNSTTFKKLNDRDSVNLEFDLMGWL